jgi:hypothetical protein
MEMRENQPDFELLSRPFTYDQIEEPAGEIIIESTGLIDFCAILIVSQLFG